MRPNAQLPAELVTLTEEILNGKLHFCSVLFEEYYCNALDYLITSKEGFINNAFSDAEFPIKKCNILGEKPRDDFNAFSVYASTDGQVRFLTKFINGSNLWSLFYWSNAFKNVCWIKWCNPSCTGQKMNFSMKDLFSKCDQIHWKLWIWSNLLKTSLKENFIFCAALGFHIAEVDLSRAYV